MPFLQLQSQPGGKALTFETPEVRFGRDPSCAIVVTGAGSDVVSAHHARLVHREGGWWLEDLGSRNGTFLNDQRVAPGQPQRLSTGAVIRLGGRGPHWRVDAVEQQRMDATVVEDPGATLPLDESPPVEGAVSEPARPESKRAPGPRVPTVIITKSGSGESFRVAGSRIRIGRGKECELRPVGPDDTSVSRVHSEIVLRPDAKIVVRDAKSRNGTYVGGRRVVGDRELSIGDVLELGLGGPQLTVIDISMPPEEAVPPVASAGPVPGKRRSLRRSFGGKGATVFFNQLIQESSRRSARRLRRVIWSGVAVLVAIVAAVYWYQDRLERSVAQQLAAQQAAADSIRRTGAVEYERLRTELEEARAGSAPRDVVDSLRAALELAESRTTALETALERAKTSLAQQLAAGDSVRLQAQREWRRLQSDLERARASGTPQALLDSLREAVRHAEERAAQVAAKADAVRAGDLAAVAQGNQGAVGLVTTYAGAEVFDGSGFAITASGYFVTNRHVVQPQADLSADSIFVTMADQRTNRRARLVGAIEAPGPDLALLKIEGHDGSRVAGIDWAGVGAKQGEPAALIGFPAGFGNAIDATGVVRTTMTAGIFAKVTAETINFDGFTVGGSSGSPIFNARGEVVAVHRAGLREAIGMGFAVPVFRLLQLLPPAAREELGVQ